ncbi:DUF6689 family protein [Microbulbifer sp. HZ11]|uniref:DUF6689 family protein n=1 Tax=Microbulbifer sp. HZ11 TaxID=1453501 RepID=UPI000A449DAD|nr:DUF6689 family protein [Microbulbifer sp. HZ11]
MSLPSLAAITETEISDNSAQFTISEGSKSVELTLSFDSVKNLDATSAGVDSYTFSLSDPNVVARLPEGVEPLADFPVMIVIEPPASEELSFRGAADVMVYTRDIHFDNNYRVFKSHEGETFQDLTAEHSEGSYRARLRTGNFSEWMVVRDNRDPKDVIALKYQRLSDAISSSKLGWLTTNRLLDQLNLSRLFWEQGNTLLAITTLDVVIGLIDSLAGSLISNVWHATSPLTNTAGDLLGASATLRFSLSQG